MTLDRLNRNWRTGDQKIGDLTPAHRDKKTGVHGAGTSSLLNTGDVDDTPVDGATTAPVSSNWAYDHVAAADPHTGYVLESLFDAQSILQATSDNTPVALTAGEQTIVGRVTGGNIVALTASQVYGILGTYAEFYQTAEQTSAGTTSANAVSWDNEEYKVGITHDTGSNPERITFPTAGVYQVSFRMSVMASAPNKHIDVWMAVDGTNDVYSNIKLELPISGEALISDTHIMSVTAGQYVTLLWAGTDDASMKLFAAATASTPTRPATPSAHISINRIG